MEKEDSKILNENDEINLVGNEKNEGEDMQSQTCLKIKENNKEEDSMSSVVSERRSVNSDRRINNTQNYTGPARRMNIDRRK